MSCLIILFQPKTAASFVTFFTFMGNAAQILWPLPAYLTEISTGTRQGRGPFIAHVSFLQGVICKVQPLQCRQSCSCSWLKDAAGQSCATVLAYLLPFANWLVYLFFEFVFFKLRNDNDNDDDDDDDGGDDDGETRLQIP